MASAATFCTDYLPAPKQDLDSGVLITLFREQRALASFDAEIYTDGSKAEDGSAAGFGIWCPTTRSQQIRRVSPALSICFVELAAILHGLQLASTSPMRKLLIVTDSLSALEVIRSNSSCSLAVNVRELVQLFEWVTFLWAPAHTGISDNEKADQLAKSALQAEGFFSVEIPWQDARRVIRQSMTAKWTERWQNGDTGRLLFSIKPVPQRWEFTGRWPRTIERLLASLRCRRVALPDIRCFLGLADDPSCPHCGALGSVEHFLLRCPSYDSQRRVLQEVARANQVPFSVNSLLGGSDLAFRQQLELAQAVVDYVRSTTGLKELLSLYG